MSRRTTAAAACIAAATLAAVATFAGGERRQPDAPVTPLIPKSQYTVVIPRANYQAIVISPQDAGPNHAGAARNDPLPFIIRTRDAMGRVSDFPLFVRVGDVHTVTFPSGWSPSTEAALFAPGEAIFAAWGVTAGVGTAGGQTIRFEPLGRDPQRDDRDRERARTFEEFLREVKRSQ